MATKPKSKKAAMTLEGVATAIQQDLSAIRNDMTTGFRTVREEMGKMREEMATKEDFAAASDRISTAKDELQEQIAGLRYAKEIDALAERVKFVEQKLGIKHSRRGA